MKHSTIRRTTALALLGALAFASLAATFVDRFVGTTFASTWMEVEQGSTLRQANGKVLFSVSQPSSPVAFAGLLNTAYQIDCTQPWQISFNYALNQRTTPAAGVSSGPMVLLGFDNGSGGQLSIVPIVYRTSTGTFVGLATDDGSGDVVLEPFGRAPATGTLIVKYTASLGMLEIGTAGGGTKRIIQNFRSRLVNPRTLYWGIGCVTLDSAMRYTFTDTVSASNLVASGPGVQKQ